MPWGALGGFGYPWRFPRGPMSIFDGFWVSLGRAWAAVFRKNMSLDDDFSLHDFRMVPGIIF